MTETMWFAAIIGAFWFPVYWVFGGVLFAIISLFRMTKMRKAQFSCLFSLSSIFIAFGAGYGGVKLGEGQVQACIEPNITFFDTLSAVIGCGVLEIFAAGAIGFGALILVGLFLMIITKARNQSWMDSDMGLNDNDELTFDNI